MPNYGLIAEKTYQATSAKFGVIPQIIFWIMNERNSEIYERIKKNMDCRWAVASQGMCFIRK